ncbi:MAG: quinolinate synthase NadA [Candidatus Kapabacteria bacterium]|nr:quinolinate synthase NadA [Candidatus Kapabacteria bacterium]MBP7093239.1 quinolinate synthase NadA [Candidatus Kapabacteria bacterium]
MQMSELTDRIAELKRRQNAVIYAHYYQDERIQSVADWIGDSQQLAAKAQGSHADVILIAGVRFMAETAKLLNPDKIVLAPTLEASCSLVEQSPPDAYRRFIDEHPDHEVVSYVNSSLELKAMSHVVCTSSNAESIISRIPEGRPILFGPDRNLGRWLAERSGREILTWNGHCEVHDVFDAVQISRAKDKDPEAVVLAHPECTEAVLKISDVIGSTSYLLRYVAEHPQGRFIVATEAGILIEMQKVAPEATLIPAPPKHVTECACSECPHMKKNTLELVHNALVTLQPRIEIEPELLERARAPILRMFAEQT